MHKFPLVWHILHSMVYGEITPKQVWSETKNMALSPRITHLLLNNTHKISHGPWAWPCSDKSYVYINEAGILKLREIAVF